MVKFMSWLGGPLEKIYDKWRRCATCLFASPPPRNGAFSSAWPSVGPSLCTFALPALRRPECYRISQSMPWGELSQDDRLGIVDRYQFVIFAKFTSAPGRRHRSSPGFSVRTDRSSLSSRRFLSRAACCPAAFFAAPRYLLSSGSRVSTRLATTLAASSSSVGDPARRSPRGTPVNTPIHDLAPWRWRGGENRARRT